MPARKASAAPERATAYDPPPDASYRPPAKIGVDPKETLAVAEQALDQSPSDPEVLARLARVCLEVRDALGAGRDRDRADEAARNAVARCFQADPRRPQSAELLWAAHAEIRSKLAALGPQALPQRVQALATLREAMSQTLARNPSDASCKKLVAAASFELGDAVSLAGQREKALELWNEAASFDASLVAEVERRKAGR